METKEAKQFRLKLGVINDGDRVRGVTPVGWADEVKSFEGTIETKWFVVAVDNTPFYRVVVDTVGEMISVGSVSVRLTDIHEIL